MNDEFVVPIYTSYFGNRDIWDGRYIPISVARKRPYWLTDQIPTYHKAIPTYQTVTEWYQSAKDEEAMVNYVKHYYRTVLVTHGPDSPIIHADNILTLASDAKCKYGDKPIVLTCYEGPGKFCHRIVYAIYLKLTAGIIIPELGYDPIQPSFAQTIITETLQKLIKGVLQ